MKYVAQQEDSVKDRLLLTATLCCVVLRPGDVRKRQEDVCLVSNSSYEPLPGLRSMSGTIKEFVLPAFTKLMRPLVQILLRNGVAFGEFAEILKRLYVETAVSTYQSAGSPITQSKVALATGLTRQDVARLLGEPTLDIEALEAQTNRVGRILTCWHQEQDFTGPYGFPLELPFDADRKAKLYRACSPSWG